MVESPTTGYDCSINSITPHVCSDTTHSIEDSCGHKTRPLSIWPHLFHGAGHEKRRGEQLKWSLAFRLYIGSLPCAQLPGPVHTDRLGRVFFGVFSLGLCFVCYLCFLNCLYVPILLCFPEQLSHLS